MSQESLRCHFHGLPAMFLCADKNCSATFSCVLPECLAKHSSCSKLISAAVFAHRLDDFSSQFHKQIEIEICKYFDKMAENILDRINQNKKQALEYANLIVRREGQKRNSRVVKVLGKKDLKKCSKQTLLDVLDVFEDQIPQIVLLKKDLEMQINDLFNTPSRNISIWECFSELIDGLKLTITEYINLQHLLKPKQIVLRNAKILYNAKKHDFKNAIFHQICDSEANTLTIIRAQHGRLFGGFASISWDSKIVDNEAFLFSVDEMKIFDMKEAKLSSGLQQGPGWKQGYEQQLLIKSKYRCESNINNRNPNKISLACQSTVSINNYLVLSIQ